MSREDFSGFQKYIKVAYDIKEAMVRLGFSRELIENLRDKIKLSKVIPQYVIDNQLLIFLNSCNGDVDKTITKLEKYYELKRSMPEFFHNRDVASDDIQHCLNSLVYVSLPTTNDCYVLLHKLKSCDPKDWWFDAGVKTFIMKTEALAFHEGPRAGSGIVFIDDFEGASIWHLFRPCLNSIRKGLKFLQEGSPFEVKAVHLLNTPYFLDKVLAIVKPLLRSELFNKIHVHSSTKDLESFYKEFIPKSNLPLEYGGDLESVEVLHNKQREAFMEMREYFLMEEQQKNFEYDKFADEWNECRHKCF